MGSENQDVKLTIIELENSIKPTVTYIAGNVRTAINISRFAISSQNFDEIALMKIATPHQIVGATHAVIELSYNISRNVAHPDISLQDIASVVYNVLRDRYKLPIPAAKVAESLYAERKYHPLVKEINLFIDEVVNFSEVPEKEAQPVNFTANALREQQESGKTEEENPYSLNLDMEMKGLTVEQYSELITLITSYIKKNNANGKKNCSLVIK
nr:MAG TPA: hypothetical protein [Caudoviricetes sp.]